MKKIRPYLRLNVIALILNPLVILVVGISLSIATTRYFNNALQNESRAKYEQEISTVKTAINNRVDLYVSAMISTQGLFSASDVVNRAEYRDYFKQIDLFNRYPGIAAVSFIQHVKTEDLAAFTQSVKSDTTYNPAGFPKFEIKQLSKETDHYIVNYIEPYNPDSAVFGTDFSSIPSRYNAIINARDTGMPVVTEKLTLIGTGSAGFAIVVPIYQRGLPLDTVEQKRAAFKGALNGTFVIEDLFGKVFSQGLNQEISLEIYDNQRSDEHLLYTRNVTSYANERVETIDFSSRKWIVVLKSPDKFGISEIERFLPNILLAGGILLSLAITLLLYFLTTSRSRAISMANSIATKLRETDLRLRAVIDRVPIIFFATDKTGAITLSEGKGLKDVDLKPGELVGKSLFDVYEGNAEAIADLREALTGKEMTVRVNFKDVVFETTYSPVFLNGEFAGLTGVSFNITEDLKSEAKTKQHNAEIERMNKVMIDRELKMIELKKQIKQLEANNETKNQ